MARGDGRPRCSGCGLHLEACICAELPRLRLRTRIVLVQHVRERAKPTSTGRLLARVVADLPVVHYPLIDRSFDAAPFSAPGARHVVVFPREDAEVLDGERIRALVGSGVGFVLLDGTWHQCSRMTRRVPFVREMPCVALPPGPPSRWGVRTQHDPRGLSTFEAAMRLLGPAERPEDLAALDRAFELVNAKMVAQRRGRIAGEPVPPTTSP